MDNQHRKISGYRELSQADIDLMNKVKAFGPLLEELGLEVKAHIQAQRREEASSHTTFTDRQDTEQSRLDRAQPERWAAIGLTHFQEGLMALTRAVAQPTFF